MFSILKTTLLTALGLTLSTSTFAGNERISEEPIYGTLSIGKTNTSRETRPVGPFSKISANGGLTIYLTKGDKESLEVEYEGTEKSTITTKVVGKTLELNTNYKKMKWGGNSKITAYITVKDLSAINLAGAVVIKTTGTFTSKSLSIDCSGSANLNLNLETENLKIDISGSGDILLNGKANKVDLDIAGSGTVNAFGLKALDVDADIAGSGSAEFTVLNSLDVDVSGSGSVLYKGNPKTVKKDVSGSGSIKAAE